MNHSTLRILSEYGSCRSLCGRPCPQAGAAGGRQDKLLWTPTKALRYLLFALNQHRKSTTLKQSPGFEPKFQTKSLQGSSPAYTRNVSKAALGFGSWSLGIPRRCANKSTLSGAVATEASRSLTTASTSGGRATELAATMLTGQFQETAESAKFASTIRIQTPGSTTPIGGQRGVPNGKALGAAALA